MRCRLANADTGTVGRVIVPEDKDWTWVLHTPCPQCGFDARAVERTTVAGLVRENARVWQRLLADGVIRPGRPDDSTWSTLEYACHVRDVYRRFEARLGLMIEHDDPLFENWDQDASAVDDRYEEQDPATVVAELDAAAGRMADRLDSVKPDEWDRPGRRSNGSLFTVESLALYMIHDPIHHAWDVSPVG